MNRNESKIWASIPREKLAVIAPNIDKHYDMLCAFANGAEIEVFSVELNEWYKVEDAAFNYASKYRVKLNPQPTEPWKPELNENYFYVNSDGNVLSTPFFRTSKQDQMCHEFGNCFRTRAEAESAMERVRAALKGEVATTPKKPVESLDENPLTEGEKHLIREIRKSKILHVREYDKSICCFSGPNGNVSTSYSDISFLTKTDNPDDDKIIRDALIEIKREQEATLQDKSENQN